MLWKLNSPIHLPPVFDPTLSMAAHTHLEDLFYITFSPISGTCIYMYIRAVYIQPEVQGKTLPPVKRSSIVSNRRM